MPFLEIFYIFFEIFGAKVILYAVWQINTYTVTYNYTENGGSSATKTSASVNYGSTIDLTPTATKSGYTFVGWNTNKDGTSKLSSLTMDDSNVTLYAIYVDDIAPTINALSANTSNWTNQDITLTGKATDIGSGLVAYQFSTNNSLTSSSNGWTTITNTKSEMSKTYTVSDNGTYYFYVKDSSGNINKKSISITNIDKIAPNIRTEIDSSLNIDFSNWSLEGEAYINSDGNLVLPSKDSAAFSPYLDVSGSYWLWQYDFISSEVSAQSGNKQAGTLTNAYYYDTNLKSVNANNGYSGNGYFANSEVNTQGHVKFDGYFGYGPDVKYVTVRILGDGYYSSTPLIVSNPRFTTKSSISNKSKIITVNSDDKESGIKITKWLSGTKTENDFVSSGIEFSSEFEVTKNSIYTIYVEDNAGNKQLSTINVTGIDNDLPILGSLIANTTSWTNQNVILTGNAIDRTSGISYYQFSTNSSLSALSDGWITIENTKSEISVSTTISNNNTYYFYVKDATGNINKKSIVINNIDKTAPTAPIISNPTNGNWTNDEISITLNSTDKDSGVVKYQVNYSDSGNTWIDISGNTDIWSFPRNETVYYRAIDKAGNISSTSSTVIKIDKTAPTSPVISNSTNGNWTNDKVSITLNSTDTDSGIDKYQVKYSDSENKWVDISGNIDVWTGQRNETVYYRAIDKAGNISSISSTVIKIDKIAPTAPVISNSTNGNWTNDKVSITLSSTDTDSGIDKYQVNYSDSGNKWVDISGNIDVWTSQRNETVYYRAIDKAGNISSTSSTIIRIKK